MRGMNYFKEKDILVEIQKNVPLADKNWFRTGGNAQFFCEPTIKQDFNKALEYANTNARNITLLGQGANVMISDAGIKGLVIRPQLNNLSINQELSQVTAGAGVDFQKLTEQLLDHNLLGFEEFSGIPSSVGGAVYINIHFFAYLLSSFLIKATVIEKTTGEIFEVDNDWFNFGYNTSTLLDGNHYLLDATFQLKAGSALESAYAKGRRFEMINLRTKRYPYERTCGSFFRNFNEHELTAAHQKLKHVAYYLDKLAIKGSLQVGGAKVSWQHANMLVTEPGATTDDLVRLARTIQEIVQESFGLLPQPECQMLGFDEYPLYSAKSHPAKSSLDSQP